MHRLHVRVPATSANLGPGFDTLGIALSLNDELLVELSEGSATTVQVTGVGEGQVPTDETNLVVRSAAHVFERYGRTLPALKIEAHNRIPHGRGMGSSGSAIVAGIKIAAGLLARDAHPIHLDDHALLNLATELEGHPDNVAPALFGGLTIAWVGDDGAPHFKGLAVHRGVSPLVLVPNFTMSTELARSLQPAQVPHEDAVFNVSRSALLIAALTQSPEMMFEATEDRLHQNYRADAMPQTRDLIRVLRDAGHAAVVSGAGPSILVLSEDPGSRMAATELAAAHGTEWTAMLLAVDIKGATVEVASA